MDTGATGSFDLDTHCHNCHNKHIDHEYQMVVERRGVISRTVDSSGGQYVQSVAAEGSVFFIKDVSVSWQISRRMEACLNAVRWYRWKQ